MIEFASKQGGRWKHYHLNYDWNMCALITLEDFTVKGRVHKMFIIILHIVRMTQTTSLPKIKPKILLILFAITLHQTWPSFFLIHALHLQRLVNN